MTLPAYISGSKVLDGTSFNQQEVELYAETINVLSTMYNTFGTPMVSLLTAEQGKLRTLAEIAKSDFKGAQFGGSYLKLGFNAGFPRPASFLSQTATVPTETFVQAGASTLGWQALFGSEGSPFNTGLSTTNTNTSTYTYNNVTYGLTGLIAYGSPKISEIKLYIEAEKYPIFRLQPVKLAGESAVYYLKFPKPIYLGLNQTFAIEANFDALGQIDIQPFGLQFSKSDYLQYK